jgi:SET domain-containing protein
MIGIITQDKVKLVETSKGYHSLQANDFIRKGETILIINGTISPVQTRYSIQVDDDRHISADLYSESLDNAETHWRFLNHGCEPNAWLRFPDLHLVALRDIAPGEEFFYNYHTTEYQLQSPFPCNCGSKDCYGEIKGYRFLTKAQRKKIEGITAPHLG